MAAKKHFHTDVFHDCTAWYGAIPSLQTDHWAQRFNSSVLNPLSGVKSICLVSIQSRRQPAGIWYSLPGSHSPRSASMPKKKESHSFKTRSQSSMLHDPGICNGSYAVIAEARNSWKYAGVHLCSKCHVLQMPTKRQQSGDISATAEQARIAQDPLINFQGFPDCQSKII